MKHIITECLIKKGKDGQSGIIYINTTKDPLPDGTIPEGILTSYFYVSPEIVQSVTPGTEVNMVGHSGELDPVLFSVSGKVHSVTLYDEELGSHVSLHLPSGNWIATRLPYYFGKHLEPGQELVVSVISLSELVPGAPKPDSDKVGGPVNPEPQCRAITTDESSETGPNQGAEQNIHVSVLDNFGDRIKDLENGKRLYEELVLQLTQYIDVLSTKVSDLEKKAAEISTTSTNDLPDDKARLFLEHECSFGTVINSIAQLNGWWKFIEFVNYSEKGSRKIHCLKQTVLQRNQKVYYSIVLISGSEENQNFMHFFSTDQPFSTHFMHGKEYFPLSSQTSFITI